jgi:carbon-monoxide dehydrogenase medium subunit
MKPPPFDYHDPRNLDEALELLRRHGGEAKVLAGGQSLMPLLNFRLSRPAALVDINRISALGYIREENDQLSLGAMTRQRAIEFSPLVRERLPLLQEATTLVGHLPIRTRGTIGGSLAHADPAAELPAVVTALDGDLVVRGPGGERILRPQEFFLGYLTTALAPDEILVEIRLPTTPPGSGWAFEELSRRHGDFALAGIAAVLVADSRRCRMARLAAAGVGPTPVRLRGAEEILEREGLSKESLEAAAAQAQELVEPDSDLHASADYRRHLTGVLTGRALHRAAARCREGR